MAGPPTLPIWTILLGLNIKEKDPTSAMKNPSVEDPNIFSPYSALKTKPDPDSFEKIRKNFGGGMKFVAFLIDLIIQFR